MQSIAAASGATLGYIIGNLPGAYYGYQFGKAMAPIRTPRKLRGSYRPYPTPRTASIPSWRARTRSRTSTGSGMRSLLSNLGHESIVTAQHDVKKQYRYKKMPRYKKRAWRKFSKKVAAVQLKQAGLKTVVFNSRGTVSNAAGFQQQILLSLFGVAGAIDTNQLHGFNDLYRIFKNDPDIIQIGAAPGNVPKSGKLQFGSGVLDFTIRNLSDVIEAELDIYYGWYKKDDDGASAKADTNPLTKYANAAADLVNPSNTAVNIGQRGATLFDKPAGLSATGYHITKKFKMILAPGQSTFLQHRDAKNYMIDWTNINDVGYAKKGLTFGVWIVFKPSITAADDAVATLGVGVTRKYSYAKVEDNVDRIAYNPPN